MILDKNRLQDMYHDIELSISAVKNNANQNSLQQLKDNLNKFFSDAKCLGIIYTNNLDKMFFGIMVMPIIEADTVVVDVIVNGKTYLIDKYYVELDSKLFGPELDLDETELSCLLIHDVGQLVNDSSPCRTVRALLDKYLVKNNDVLKISDSIHYRELLSYGFRDALHKTTSIFEKSIYIPNKGDIFEEFVDWYDYPKRLASAFNKISRMNYNYNAESKNKLVTLSWVMRLYKDILHNRIAALKTIERCKEITPSQLEKKELDNLARRLVRIDDDALLESANSDLLDTVRDKFSPIRNTPNYMLLEQMENDLVGIVASQYALENEPDALFDLLHSCNKNMSIMKDMVMNTPSLGKEEVKQWNEMFKRLDVTRKNLLKANVFPVSKSLYDKFELGDQQ